MSINVSVHINTHMHIHMSTAVKLGSAVQARRPAIAGMTLAPVFEQVVYTAAPMDREPLYLEQHPWPKGYSLGQLRTRTVLPECTEDTFSVMKRAHRTCR